MPAGRESAGPLAQTTWKDTGRRGPRSGLWGRVAARLRLTRQARDRRTVVGLDRQEVGDELRAELGGGRHAPVAETFRPADPARA